MTATPTQPRAASESVASLVQDATSQMNQLVRQEVRLATLEMQAKGKRLGLGSGLAGAAAVIAFLGVVAMLAAAILGIAVVLPGWAAALIIGGGLLLLAAIAGLIGLRSIRKAVPPVPREAAADVKEDIALIRERGHR